MFQIKNPIAIASIKVLILISTIAHHNPFLILIALPVLIGALLLFWRTNVDRQTKVKWTKRSVFPIVIGYSTLGVVMLILSYT